MKHIDTGHQGFNEFLLKYLGEVKTLIYSAFIFLHIDVDVVKVLMILMAVDTVAGVWKAACLRDKVEFRKLFFGVTSKVMVLVIPMTLALVGKGLKYDFTPLVDVLLRALVVAEGISIFASLYSIRSGRRVENVDLVTKVLASVRKGLLSLFGFFLRKIEDPVALLDETKNNINTETNADDITNH